jgi:hypothetical protein
MWSLSVPFPVLHFDVGRLRPHPRWSPTQSQQPYFYLAAYSSYRGSTTMAMLSSRRLSSASLSRWNDSQSTSWNLSVIGSTWRRRRSCEGQWIPAGRLRCVSGLRDSYDFVRGKYSVWKECYSCIRQGIPSIISYLRLRRINHTLHYFLFTAS